MAIVPNHLSHVFFKDSTYVLIVNEFNISSNILSVGILGRSNTYLQLERLLQGHNYCLYGDPAYTVRPLLRKLYWHQLHH